MVSSKRPVNPDAVIIYVSFILFLSRLYVCRHMPPLYSGMDYYGYIELAKNIFHHWDFTVRWELGSPVRYPPFFSVLIYLVTYLTRDFVASIQLISIFCASFYLVPLFSLVRNILNVYFAVFAAVFTTYYFGIQPCYLLNMDFFYSFLIIVICWLIWDTLTNRRYRAARYLLAGVLISIAYLTKFSGIIFGCAALASVLYYFVRHQKSLKDGLRYCGFLLLGAAPLIMAYQILTHHGPRVEAPSIATYAFYDGNYFYENGLDFREERISELNAQGTGYRHTDRLKAADEFSFLLKRPLFVADKYWWGLNKLTQAMTFSILPGGNIAVSRFDGIGPEGSRVFFALRGNGWDGVLRDVSSTEVQINPEIDLREASVRQAAGADFNKAWDILRRSFDSRRDINLIFQGSFFLLLMASGVYFKWHFNMMHILFFVFGLLFIPVYLVHERYLLPFMPLYFVLWLFIFNAGYSVISKEMKDRVFLRNAVFIIFLSFFLIYFINGCKQIDQTRRFFKYENKQDEAWRLTGAWVKKVSADIHQRARIMSYSSNYLSYLTGSDYLRLPYAISNWDKVIDFAVRKDVNYIVFGGDYLDTFLLFSGNEFSKPVAPAVIDSLNKQLGTRDLYKALPVHPVEALNLIHRLRLGESLTPFELRLLNRCLLEANFSRETPHMLFLDINKNNANGRVKMAHEVKVDNIILLAVNIEG